MKVLNTKQRVYIKRNIDRIVKQFPSLCVAQIRYRVTMWVLDHEDEIMAMDNHEYCGEVARFADDYFNSLARSM